LPEDYRGIVVERVPQQDPKTAVEEHVVDLDAEEEQIENMQITAEFDEMVVWGHEAVADASADPYVRSMEEWLQVADKVCMHPDTGADI
jgi:ribonuclease H2 subunit C